MRLRKVSGEGGASESSDDRIVTAPLKIPSSSLSETALANPAFEFSNCDILFILILPDFHLAFTHLVWREGVVSIFVDLKGNHYIDVL